MLRLATTLVVVAALLVGAGAASAQPAAGQTPLYQFGEIVVTGERERVADSVAAVDVVTADEIARSGARTVDEAIALLPGLYVRRGAEGVPTFPASTKLLPLMGAPRKTRPHKTPATGAGATEDPPTRSDRSLGGLRLFRKAVSRRRTHRAEGRSNVLKERG